MDFKKDPNFVETTNHVSHPAGATVPIQGPDGLVRNLPMLGAQTIQLGISQMSENGGEPKNVLMIALAAGGGGVFQLFDREEALRFADAIFDAVNAMDGKDGDPTHVIQ